MKTKQPGQPVAEGACAERAIHFEESSLVSLISVNGCHSTSYENTAAFGRKNGRGSVASTIFRRRLKILKRNVVVFDVRHPAICESNH